VYSEFANTPLKKQQAHPAKCDGRGSPFSLENLVETEKMLQGRQLELFAFAVSSLCAYLQHESPVCLEWETSLRKSNFTEPRLVPVPSQKTHCVLQAPAIPHPGFVNGSTTVNSSLHSYLRYKFAAVPRRFHSNVTSRYLLVSHMHEGRKGLVLSLIAVSYLSACSMILGSPHTCACVGHI
jgi:hypothetical protein